MNKFSGVSENIVVLVARLYPLFRQVFSDYHPDEIWVLHILRLNDGELPRKKLIQVIRLDEKIVSRRIRNLVSLGLVESCRDSNSARESIDKITSKGNEEFEKIRNKIKFFLSKGFAFLSESEKETLSDIIGKADVQLGSIMGIINTMFK